MAFSGSQTTRHGLYGGPRGLYGSFAGKTVGGTNVTGPACWAAGMVYLPGFQAGDAYNPGFQAGEVYNPGFQSGQESCN